MVETNKRSILKATAVLSTLLITIMACCIPLPTKAASDADIGRDTILIIDSSSSMRTDSDPKRVAIEAARLYIDYNETQNSNVAVIAFASDIKMSTGFIDASNPDSREELKRSIQDIRYDGYTDMGAGMSEAKNVLEQWLREHPERSEKALVLLLSDGVTDISRDSDRTVELSDAEKEDAVEYFESKGVPVYTIGLNAGENYNREDLQRISDRTDALTFTTSNAKELPDIIKSIFEDSRGAVADGDVIEFTADGDNYYSCRISIPNPSILESNILIRYGKKLKDVEITDPDGDLYELVNNDKTIVSASDTYTLIKLLRPQKGEWELKVLGARDDDVIITLTNNFSLAAVIDISPDPSQLNVHQEITVSSKLQTAAEDVEIAEETYEGIDCSVVIADMQGKIISETPMQYMSSTSSMSVAIKLDEPGEFQLWTAYSANYIERQSDTVTIEVKNSAPVLTGSLEEYRFDIYGDADTDCVINDILSQYSDNEGCELTIEPVDFDASIVDISISGSDVIVRVAGEGTTAFKYQITDEHDKSVSGSVTVKVGNIRKIVLIAAGAALLSAAVLATVLIRAKKKSRGYWNGSLNVALRMQDDGIDQLLINDHMDDFGNRKLSLAEVFDNDLRMNNGNDIRGLLNRVTVEPLRGGRAMTVTCKPGGKTEVQGGQFSRETIEIAANGGNVVLEITYLPVDDEM